MVPTEAERFELREGMRNVLGEGQVTTLMDSLPPMDWHELATKTDLAALEERMDARFEVVDARFEVVDVRLEALRTELGAKIDTGLTDLNAKIDTGLARGRGGVGGVRGGARATTLATRAEARPTR
ncbi:MAG: hypothetical protein OXE75_08485, partial [bacterium]|nr:hypothetical protein [bacterium]